MEASKNDTLDFSCVSVADVPISMKNLEIDIEGVLSGRIDGDKFSDLLTKSIAAS